MNPQSDSDQLISREPFTFLFEMQVYKSVDRVSDIAFRNPSWGHLMFQYHGQGKHIVTTNERP